MLSNPHPWQLVATLNAELLSLKYYFGWDACDFLQTKTTRNLVHYGLSDTKLIDRLLHPSQ